jgi:glycosyltransferase involved in cell wall biosynthesis
LLILSEIIAPYRIPVFNALSRHEDIELHVVFLSETDSALRRWRIYKDEICFSYEVLQSWRIRSGKQSLLLNWGLRSCLKKFVPDAIICGGYNYFASWEALSWTRRHPAELILWAESNGEDIRGREPWVEALKARFLAGCDWFVVPGSASRTYLESLRSSPKKIVTAPNAVDNHWFQVQADSVRFRDAEFRTQYRLPDRYLLFVGRLIREKGIFDLLDAYSKLEGELRRKVGLVFAGDGQCLPELRELARRISPGNICFPGFVHREDLAGFYALAEASILPTHSDPWGLVVNEAMACGLPVIVSSVAGCATDLVDDGWNGYIVPPRDQERLGEALTSILTNPMLQKEMGTRSTKRISNYSPEACAQGLAVAALASEGRVR